MAHSIPQREKAQAAEDSDTNRSLEYTGWPAGWCIVSEPETLFHETAIPLLVRCGNRPGALDLEIPGLAHGVNWPIDTGAEFRMTPHGFRIIEESEASDLILSGIKLDASTLLVEGPLEKLGCWLETDRSRDLNTSHDIMTAGRYALVTYLHTFDTSARLAIVSGTADTGLLLTRARGLVHQSAHQLLDAVLTSRTAGNPDAGRFVLTPLDGLLSRLRPASPTLPFPWLANDEEEPEWRLTSLYPAVSALIPAYPELAAGIIGNLLDTMDVHGRLVVAGGNASPLFHGDTEYPLLVQLVWEYFNQHGQWPDDLEHRMRQLQRYLAAASESTALAATGAILWPQEINAWSRLVSQSGIGTPVAGRPLPVPPDLSAAFQSLLAADASEASQRAAADSLLAQLDQPPDQPIDAAHIGMAVRCLAGMSSWNPDLARSLRGRMRPLATAHWHAMASHGATRPDGIALAGWCALLASDAHAPRPRGAFTRLINQHRRAVNILGVLAVAAVIAFLLTVQFRTTMPTTVYETQLGLALQDYQMGRYAEAVEKLKDIEARGHARNPINLMALGKTYFRARQYNEAAATFATLTEAAPNLPAGHFNYGLSLFHAGKRDEAISVFASMSQRFAPTHPAIAARAAKAAEIGRQFGEQAKAD